MFMQAARQPVGRRILSYSPPGVAERDCLVDPDLARIRTAEAHELCQPPQQT
jgi:hypothetical protein